MERIEQRYKERYEIGEFGEIRNRRISKFSKLNNIYSPPLFLFYCSIGGGLQNERSCTQWINVFQILTK